MEKSNCHCTRVYWFSSSQCKIMHLKLASGAAHICSLPVTPTLLLGRESVKGFSNAKSSYSRGSWGGRCHLCDTGGWGQSTQPNNKDVILRPTPFSVTDFRCDILLFVLNEKAKEKTRPSSLLKALTSHPASAGLMLRAVKYLRERVMWGRSYLGWALAVHVEVKRNLTLKQQQKKSSWLEVLHVLLFQVFLW